VPPLTLRAGKVRRFERFEDWDEAIAAMDGGSGRS
jgi:hypothetical protein